MSWPSGSGGDLTQQVGFFECAHAAVAEWLAEGLGWRVVEAKWRSFVDVLDALKPAALLSRHACLSVGGWTLLVNNAPRGTDVGVLPSYAARELGCRAVRAVYIEEGGIRLPATVLDVYGPAGEPPLKLERGISLVHDGGKWEFDVVGTAFPFERLEQYANRRKSMRFTGAMLKDYLSALGVPVDVAPEWQSAFVVQR